MYAHTHLHTHSSNGCLFLRSVDVERLPHIPAPAASFYFNLTFDKYLRRPVLCKAVIVVLPTKEVQTECFGDLLQRELTFQTQGRTAEMARDESGRLVSQAVILF